MPKSRSATPTPPAQPESTRAQGEKVVSMRIPTDLALWSLRQARVEGTTRTAKVVEMLRQWRSEVDADSAAQKARRQAEIEAAVAAALKADRRKRSRPSP